MSFPESVIDVVRTVSPVLGTALSGPVGGVIGSLISTLLGGIDMQNTKEVVKALDDPEAVQKIKTLEIQINDIQNARLFAEKEMGNFRLIRPFLAFLAMCAIFADVYAIQFVTDKMLNEVLIMMLVFLVWDIRQIYKFYFGSSNEDSSNFQSMFKQKSRY